MGYTPGYRAWYTYKAGCPTQVGIYLLRCPSCARRPWLPHAGGDIPVLARLHGSVSPAAPRRWGYTVVGVANDVLHPGCPTQVGIYLFDTEPEVFEDRLPHAGGDIPISGTSDIFLNLAAPRRWGYTAATKELQEYHPGCPTQVGIYLQNSCTIQAVGWLPHAGGDIP